MEDRLYFCLDMKSFFASVECAERGLDPMTENLVVADEARGKGALCLAVSPSLKALGVKNRCRLFEIPSSINYVVAKPRMRKYVEYAADIYEIYLDYLSPEDIHVYSIDECFLDVTGYLSTYHETPKSFARKLMQLIYDKTRIPATAGIGTNLYLCKIALDITAKKSPDRIGYLTEDSFRATLWDHLPLTDFWGISRGTVRRLASKNIFTMRDIASARPELLYDLFGVNAELLIDHAYGIEPCRMEDIKAYRSKSKSVSNSQILFEDYPLDKARIVIEEMLLNGCQELMRRHLVTGRVGLFVGYSDETIPPTGGFVRMTSNTSSFRLIRQAALAYFDKTTRKNTPIRRLSVDFDGLLPDSLESYDLFTDVEQAEREKKAETAVLMIKDKFGKNAMLRGIDLVQGATTRVRNTLIGGHNGE